MNIIHRWTRAHAYAWAKAKRLVFGPTSHNEAQCADCFELPCPCYPATEPLSVQLAKAEVARTSGRGTLPACNKPLSHSETK
jgi:hypothetical protein